MSDDPEFREAMREAIRRHDPDADELRAVAADLQETAERWEEMAV
jgi:hypothetical protein